MADWYEEVGTLELFDDTSGVHKLKNGMSFNVIKSQDFHEWLKAEYPNNDHPSNFSLFATRVGNQVKYLARLYTFDDCNYVDDIESHLITHNIIEANSIEEVKTTSEMSNQVSPMTLVAGIMGFIGDNYPNIDVTTRQYNAIISAANTLTDALNTPHESAKENMGLEAWLQSNECEKSSKFLAYKLSDSSLAMCSYEHPYDAADFQQCRKMLDAIPELKSKLSKIAVESEVWAGLVEDWGLICQLIDDDKFSEAYDLINKNH